jgi:hypothetical protein
MNVKVIQLEKQLERLWSKSPKNASEAHFRAQKITEIENRIKKLKNNEKA